MPLRCSAGPALQATAQWTRTKRTRSRSAWFPGDDLFTASERRRGLPIGNQTSQFSANVYLNPFDHFVKETLRACWYIRYVDDFVIFSGDELWLDEVRRRCREYLATLRLKMHPRKSTISRVADGTRFLGFRVFPTHRLLVRENTTRVRLRWMQAEYARGALSGKEIRQRLMSWIGHARHADSYRLRTRLLAATKFVRRNESPAGIVEDKDAAVRAPLVP